MSYIAIGIDGSGGSSRALDWAAAEASRHNCDLEILHAIDIPAPTGIYGRARLSPIVVAELKRFSHDLLRAAAQRVAAIAPGIKVSTRTKIGSPAAVLVHTSLRAEAIVVGSRGLGAFEAFIGSVSTKVAARAHCPVLVIPDHGVDLPADAPIVVGIDDSKFSAAALRFALAEARLHDTTVRAVNAYQLPMVSIPLAPGVLSSFEIAAHDEAVAMVEKRVSQARTSDSDDVKVDAVAVQAPTVDSILTYADDAQLIVVGSHGRGVTGQMILGSVSRRLLHQTDRPVAVVGLSHPADS